MREYEWEQINFERRRLISEYVFVKNFIPVLVFSLHFFYKGPSSEKKVFINVFFRLLLAFLFYSFIIIIDF